MAYSTYSSANVMYRPTILKGRNFRRITIIAYHQGCYHQGYIELPKVARGHTTNVGNEIMSITIWNSNSPVLSTRAVDAHAYSRLTPTLLLGIDSELEFKFFSGIQDITSG